MRVRAKTTCPRACLTSRTNRGSAPEEKNMETKHTPKPWHLVPAGRDWQIVDDADTLLAVVCSRDGRDERDPAEVRANAELLVTAPDLLAACKAVAAKPHAVHCGVRKHTACTCHVGPCLNAIAKAEGGAS